MDKDFRYEEIKRIKAIHLSELYKESPVSLKRFICDDYYLGKSTEQGKTIYNVWKEKLKELYFDDSKYMIVFSGAIGTGKTSAAIIGMAYGLYRVMCLKNPWGVFGLADSGKMAVSFFNLTKGLSHSRGFGLLQHYIMKSQWFMEHGAMLRGQKDKYMELPQFDWVLASPYSKGFGTIGENVIFAIMDEVDSPTESESQKIRVLLAYESTVRRFDSRFVIKGQTLGRFFLVASKQDELSFLNTFVDDMKSSGRVFLVDIAIWEAKPAKNYSGIKFKVSVGDAYSSPKLVQDDVQELEERKQGFQIVEVPIEYKGDFERDIVGALRDIAGISVKGQRKSKLFPAEKFIEACFDPDKLDPVKKVTIEIGLNDDVELINYFDITKIRTPKNVPRCISCDIAFTNDALGLAMSGIKGWATVESEKTDGTFSKSRMPVVETDFVVRLKAREGDRIPLHKVRKLVLDLRAKGFNIVKYTADLRLSSEDTFQILERAGIKTEYFSVDKDVKAYADFRNMVYEKRWVCHKHSYLAFELRHLQFVHDMNKIDHPDRVKDIEWLEDGSAREVVMMGSKDCADAVVASIANVTKGIEQPMDLEAMRAIMRKVSAPESVIDMEKDNPYWFAKDVAGKKVIGATNEELNKFKTILRRMR